MEDFDFWSRIGEVVLLGSDLQTCTCQSSSVGNSSVCGCYSPECASLGELPPRPSLVVWGESSVPQREGQEAS